MITVSRLTSSYDLASYKAELDPGYLETPQTISGRDWTIIKGHAPANMINDAQYVKYAYVIEAGKEFLVGIRSTLSNFGGYESTFDTFVSLITFY
jgi:hypothetical protein